MTVVLKKRKKSRKNLEAFAAGVVVAARSSNAKLGDCAATYRTQDTCPKTCPFLGNGCYAEYGFTGMFTTSRLNRADTPDLTAVFLREAELIRALPGTRPLRLSVVGDVPTAEAAGILAAASAEYTAKHGQPVWAYTHWWATVPRRAWGSVSVLASCETPALVCKARRRGYAAALVVPSFPGRAAFRAGGETVVPCPSQTAGKTCAECRLCTRDRTLRDRGVTVGFAPHGSGTGAVRRAVELKLVS